MKLSFLLSTLIITAPFTWAGDYTIKSEPLEAKLTMKATFLPLDSQAISLSPKQWQSFIIADLVKHGTPVKAGDTLISFERADYDKALLEKKEAAKIRKLTLDQAEQDFETFKIKSAHSLEGLKLTQDRAKEALDDFNNVSRASKEELANQRVEMAKLSLSYQEEELKQLLKMYEEDGITEETEEIILKRQRTAVKREKLSLKRAKKMAKWSLEKTIPREGVDLQRTFDAAKLAYDNAKKDTPRALKKKELALEETRRKHLEADQELTEMELDGHLFTLTAEADGVVYYGEIKNHAWTLGNSAKFLRKKGKTPLNNTFLTLVPSASNLSLHGRLKQTDRLQLKPETKGTATVEGPIDTAYPVVTTGLDVAPQADGQFLVAMDVELPEDVPFVTGMQAKVEFTTYQQNEAISIPAAAITTKDGVSTVKLKMADGKNEVRTVEIGKKVGKKVEITSGLEVDQVIVVPESKKAEKPAENKAPEKPAKEEVPKKPTE